MKIEQPSLALVNSVKMPSRPAIVSDSDRNSSGGSSSIPGAVAIGPPGQDRDQSSSHNDTDENDRYEASSTSDVPIIEVQACVVPDDAERERLREELRRQNFRLRALESHLQAYRSPQVIDALPVNSKLTDGEQRAMKLLVGKPSGRIEKSQVDTTPCCVCM